MMGGTRIAGSVACAAALAALAVACGGGGYGGTPTSPGGGGTPPPGGGTTITINSSGVVTPKELTVRQGTRVLFLNSDSRSHDMTSNPHPEHTDCPEINAAGFLQPGQSRETGNLNTVRSCGFHDHDRDGDENLKGRIIITP